MVSKQKPQPKKLSILEKIQQNQRKEDKMMADMSRKERLMKWLLIGVLILLLLLILFAGYATDWLKGVNKDSANDTKTGISTTNDAATSPDGTTTGTTGGTDTTGTSTNGTSTNRSNTSNTSSTGTTGTNSSNTNRESTSSTTTNNTSTTTNNNTTTPTTPSSGLLSLYTDSSVGDTISSILNNASLLGISKQCHNEVLIQVCEFQEGDRIVTVKNLLGTGIVTSVLKNF